MKNRALLVGLFLIVAVSAGIFYWINLTAGINPTFEQRDELTNFAKQASSGRDRGATGKKDPRSSSKGAAGLFSEVPTSRNGMPLDSDPFGAKSVAEQKWLDRNGYPNYEQLITYGRAPDDMLAAAAANGDKVARVELNARRLWLGDKNAERDLFQMAVDGSIYALNVLASRMGVSGKPGYDPIKAYAYARVAEMRGDLKMPLTRDMLIPKQLSQRERLEGDAIALGVFQDLREARRVRYGDNALVDIRPYWEN